MAQTLFTLKLSDGVTSVDFISANYKVADGGFDISLPRAERNLALLRSGFYLPVSTEYKYREAKLRFTVTGATRSAVLSNLHTIEKILRKIASSPSRATGNRGELSYAWIGANDITYFEVYGGDLSFASDTLSVAKVHATVNGKFYLPDVELTLYLSPYGFGLSIFSDPGSTYEIPLANTYSSNNYVTGGVKVMNSSGTQVNYVNIRGSDLDGSQPVVTKLVLSAISTGYTRWNSMYIGVQQGPTYPTKLKFDSTEVLPGSGGSTISNGAAEGGSYNSWTFNSPSVQNVLPSFTWAIDKASAGIFYTFLHPFTPVSASVAYAIGVEGFDKWGIRFQEDFVSTNYQRYGLPLGSIQLPPTNLDLLDVLDGNDNFDTQLNLGLWLSVEAAATSTLDYISLLPIEHGLRVWHARTPRSEVGSYVDDGWKGLEYFTYPDAGDGTIQRISGVLFGMMEPLRLDPGIDQRLYFQSIGESSVASEKTRAFNVRLYGIPTYLTLAM